MKIGIIGCAGRMGRELIREASSISEVELSGGLERAGSEVIGRDLGEVATIEIQGAYVTSDLEALVKSSDALIDFTLPEVTIEVARVAANYGKAHIIGTTGFSESQISEIKNLSGKMPVVMSSNFSIGVNLLFKLTEQVASTLDLDYDIEILEMHHRKKIDAPSGTALSIGEAAARGRKAQLKTQARYSREGRVGERKPGEIGFATLRGGDVVGDHTVIFAANGERLELTHKASSRNIFARGAIHAALWTDGRKPGLYSMMDVVV